MTKKEMLLEEMELELRKLYEKMSDEEKAKILAWDIFEEDYDDDDK